MFQLRFLLLAAAMMAWLIQPAHAMRSDAENIIHLAAKLISAAALVETVSTSSHCRRSTPSSYPDSTIRPGGAISLEASIELVTRDLPSLYLSASTRSVAAALEVPMSQVKPLVLSEHCQQKNLKFRAEYFSLRDKWDLVLKEIRLLPRGEVALIRQLDADFVGTSPAQKHEVFERIDAFGVKFAHDFSRALTDEVFSPAAPAVLDQKYF